MYIMLIQTSQLAIIDLLNLPDNLVFCFLNDDLKKFQVMYATNLLTYLGRLKSNFKANPEYAWIEGNKDLRIMILETDVNKQDWRLRKSYWEDQLEKDGWKSYKEESPWGYKLDYQPEYINKVMHYVLYAKSSNGVKKLGVFRRKSQLDEFLQKCYPEGRIYKFIYQESPEASISPPDPKGSISQGGNKEGRS